MKHIYTLVLFYSCTAFTDPKPLPPKKIISPVRCQQIESFNSQKPLQIKDPKKYPITSLLISKKLRKIFALHQETVLYSFTAAFGSGYEDGAKSQEGDNRTPEGTYKVDFKKINSDFHKALHINYPSPQDSLFAQNYNVSAGGDIMIHGLSNSLGSMANLSTVGTLVNSQNWTKGCVAVRNDQIEILFELVNLNTTVEICPINP